MLGKTVVITGATSGIGWTTAQALAGAGARIVLVARSPRRVAERLDTLRQIYPQAEHAAVTADLSALANMRRAAEEIAAIAPAIDVLINNAGAMFGARGETVDGLERTFALNHMAYFVLANALLPRLLAASAARIVSTASRAHQGMRLDFDDLQMRRHYHPYTAYGRSKLCNILFTRELARRLRNTAVTAHCCHPGFVATDFAESSQGFVRAFFRIGKRLFAVSPERGAQTLIYLATATAVGETSGGYYQHCHPARPSRAAASAADAVRLWEMSTRISGVG